MAERRGNVDLDRGLSFHVSVDVSLSRRKSTQGKTTRKSGSLEKVVSRDGEEMKERWQGIEQVSMNSWSIRLQVRSLSFCGRRRPI